MMGMKELGFYKARGRESILFVSNEIYLAMNKKHILQY